MEEIFLDQKYFKKKTNDTATKDTRNIFNQEKENEEVKDRILGYIRHLFKLEKETKRY